LIFLCTKNHNEERLDTIFKHINSTEWRDINTHINVPIISPIGYSWIEMIKDKGTHIQKRTILLRQRINWLFHIISNIWYEFSSHIWFHSANDTINFVNGLSIYDSSEYLEYCIQSYVCYFMPEIAKGKLRTRTDRKNVPNNYDSFSSYWKQTKTHCKSGIRNNLFI
jgi:hypothetical protein